MLGLCSSVQSLLRTVGPTVGGFLYVNFGVSSIGTVQVVMNVIVFAYLLQRRLKKTDEQKEWRPSARLHPQSGMGDAWITVLLQEQQRPGLSGLKPGGSRSQFLRWTFCYPGFHRAELSLQPPSLNTRVTKAATKALYFSTLIIKTLVKEFMVLFDVKKLVKNKSKSRSPPGSDGTSVWWRQGEPGEIKINELLT